MNIDVRKLSRIQEESLQFITRDIREEQSAKDLITDLPPLGMLCFVCSDPRMIADGEPSEEACLGEVSKKIFHDLSAENSSRVHLFFAHGDWQPANRIVRHNRLWRSFKPEYDLACFAHASEVELAADEGVRYAAIVRLDASTLPTALKLSLWERSAVILIDGQDNLSARQQVEKFFHAAFPPKDGIPKTMLDWPHLIKTLCPDDTLLLRVVGGTEEGEISFNFIGTHTSLSHLSSWNS